MRVKQKRIICPFTLLIHVCRPLLNHQYVNSRRISQHDYEYDSYQAVSVDSISRSGVTSGLSVDAWASGCVLETPCQVPRVIAGWWRRRRGAGQSGLAGARLSWSQIQGMHTASTVSQTTQARLRDPLAFCGGHSAKHRSRCPRGVTALDFVQQPGVDDVTTVCPQNR